MSLLDRQIVLDTAHELYCAVVDTRLDEIGLKRPQGWAEFVAEVPRLDDALQAAIMWRIIGRVEQAWGYDVGLVFHHGQIADQNRGLWYLVMGCLGHGISLADDYGDDLDLAGEILGRTFDPSPIDIEAMEWMDEAQTAFPDADEAKNQADAGWQPTD